MKAAVYTTYGDPSVVHIEDIAVPSYNQNELLIKVSAAAVTVADSRIRAARFPKGFGFLAKLAFGVTKPKRQVLGSCYSGVIESVGSDVVGFKVGDEVCGMNGIKMGAHAEYIVVKASGAVTAKPKDVSHTDAAGLVFGGTAALYFIRNQAKVQAGDSVLINGASGAVGTNAVQLARYYGGHVTAVTSGDSADMVTSIGAESVIDYTQQPWDADKKTYDVILDAVGTINSKNGLARLSSKGRLVLMVAGLSEILASSAHKKIQTGSASEKKADIDFLMTLVQEGTLQIVIDSIYPFDDIVTAHQRVDSGNKKGNVVIQVS